MRARTAAIFALGFAMGILCLGVFLLWTGAARNSVRAQTSLPPWKQPMVPVPLDLKALEAKNVRPPVAEPPPPVVDASPAPSPVGTPSGPSMPKLAMPLAGLDIKTLRDTYSEKRDGHKHEALDIMAPRGTPVKAVAEGNVAKLFRSKDGGITVYQFDDSRNWCFYYAHLDRYAPGLMEGTLLRKGDVLGYVGSTGNASPTAPHLHFAIFQLKPDKKWWTGTPVDPFPYLH